MTSCIISLKRFPLSKDVMNIIIDKARCLYDQEQHKKKDAAARIIQLAYWKHYLRRGGYGPDPYHTFDENDHEYAMSTDEGNEVIHNIVMTSETWEEANVRFYAVDGVEDTVIREKITWALWTRLPKLRGRYRPDDW
jgi:hypothetical protein